MRVRNSILQRGFCSESNASTAAFSSSQIQMDSLIGGFSAQAGDFGSLIAMSAGSLGFSLTRSLASPLLSTLFRSASFIRASSWGMALVGEVTAFRSMSHLLNSPLTPTLSPGERVSGRTGEGGWIFGQAWLGTLSDFLCLKGMGHFLSGENILLRQFSQSLGMVVGEISTERLHLREETNQSFSQRFIHASVTSLAMEAGAHLTQMASGGRFEALERNIEHSRLSDSESQNLNSSIFSESLAWQGPQGFFPRIEISDENRPLRMEMDESLGNTEFPEQEPSRPSYTPEEFEMACHFLAKIDIEVLKAFADIDVLRELLKKQEHVYDYDIDHLAWRKSFAKDLLRMRERDIKKDLSSYPKILLDFSANSHHREARISLARIFEGDIRAIASQVSVAAMYRMQIILDCMKQADFPFERLPLLLDAFQRRMPPSVAVEEADEESLAFLRVRNSHDIYEGLRSFYRSSFDVSRFQDYVEEANEERQREYSILFAYLAMDICLLAEDTSASVLEEVQARLEFLQKETHGSLYFLGEDLNFRPETIPTRSRIFVNFMQALRRVYGYQVEMKEFEK